MKSDLCMVLSSGLLAVCQAPYASREEVFLREITFYKGNVSLWRITGELTPYPINIMKSLRILFACVFALFASVALVRAEAKSDKEADGASCCSAEKKAEKKDEKKDGCCPDGAVAKPEKKDDKKS